MKKKILSALVSASLLLSSGTFTAWAENNSVEKIYADIYGMDVKFASMPTEADYADLTIADLEGNAIGYTQNVDENNILHVHFNEPIQPDSSFNLNVAGAKKVVKVKKEFFEDFEGMEQSTKTSGKDKVINGTWTANPGVDGGVFFSNSDEFTGTSSMRAGVNGGTFVINKADIPNDVTLSLNVAAMFRTFAETVDGTLKNRKNCGPHLVLKGNKASYPNSYGMDITSNSAAVGVHNAANGHGYGLVKGLAAKINPAGGLQLGEMYVASADVTVMGDKATNDDYINMKWEIQKQPDEKLYVLRNYDNVIEGYVENEFIGTVIDPESRYKDKTQSVGFQSTEQSSTLIDNVLVTSCEVYDVKDVNAVGAYADTFHVEIKTDSQINGTEVVGLDKLTLKEQKSGTAVTVNKEDISFVNNTIRINVPLKTDVTYFLKAEAGFGTDVETIASDFGVMFNLTALFDEKFDTEPEQMVGTMFRTGYKSDAEGRLKVQDGKLWLTGDVVAPMVDELKTAENVTFSFDMNIYSALNRSEFAANYNRSAPFMNIGFNAEALTIGGTNDVRFTWDNYATRRFGWYILNGMVRRGHNEGNYTVVTPEEGSEYKTGDTVKYNGGAKKNFMIPSAQTATINGIGVVDYGEHYKWTTTQPIHFGDAYCHLRTEKEPYLTYTVYEKGEALPNYGGSVTVSQRETETIPVKLEKQGNVGSLVYGKTVLDTYDTQDEKTTGYFALNSQGVDILALDNMLITKYDEVNNVTDVKLVTADQKGIVLETSDNFGTIKSFEGLSVVNINTNEPVKLSGASYTGKNLFIDADLQLNVPYRVIVEPGFAGTAAYFTGSYSEFFMVKKVLSVDGSNAEQLKTIGLKENHASNAYQTIKDDHYEAFSRGFNTGKYENATITYKVAYYGIDAGAGTYGNNIIKGNGKSFVSDFVNPNNKTKVTMQTGAIDMYMASKDLDSMLLNIATADEQGLVYHNYTPTKFLNNVKLGMGIYKDDGVDENGNKKIAYVKSVEPHVERYVMANDTYRMYSNDILAFEIEQPGLNKEGYVQIGGSGRCVIWLYSAEVTQMEILEKTELKVSELTADANEIFVTFDNNVDGIKDFSKVSVTSNGAAVNASYAVNGNTMIITPVNGLVSDAVYSVDIAPEFGPSEIFTTQKPYNKKFSVTIYENEKFDNNGLAEGSTVSFKQAPTYVNGGAIFQGSVGFNSAEMKNAENYTVKFDYKLYTGSMNKDGMYDDDTVPNSRIWYNADDIGTPLNDGYYWYMNNDGVLPYAVTGGTGEKLTGGVYPERKTEFGDAYLEENGSITVFEKGDNFIDNGYDFYHKDGDVVFESERSAKLYQYQIDKSGKGASLYRDGALISVIDGTLASASSTGYFVLNAHNTEFIWIDNLQAYTFNEVSGIVVSLDTENSKAVLENFGEEVNAVVIVAAYNADNAMIDTYMADINTIPSGMTEVPFELKNADGAVTYKAFVWDNLKNLKPYSHCKITK